MPSESLPLTVLQEIDRVCDSFEAAWHAGLQPRIEDYLHVATVEHRTELFEELLAREVELRKKAGESPQAAARCTTTSRAESATNRLARCSAVAPLTTRPRRLARRIAMSVHRATSK